MDQLNILDKKILHILQNYPLEPFSSLANRLSPPISPQTMIRRVNGLHNRGILRNAIASFIPERISLTRYGVVFNISQLHQFTLLENAISEHNYIRAFNRFYGERFGIYANFDLPHDTMQIFTKFLDFLVEEEYCDSYTILKASGYRFDKPESLPHYTQEPETFDIIQYWEKRRSKAASLPRLPSAVDFETIEPLHFLILRDITSHTQNGVEIGIRTKQTDLIEHYKQYYKHLGKKIKLKYPEEHYFACLKEFFDGRNGHNAKVDFGRKYYNVVRNHLVTNPRWNFERKLFEQNVTRAFIIENVPEKDKAQIFRLLSENKPPFSTGFELLNNGIFIRLSLPPYYDTKISYLIWSTFKDYTIYSLDFFGKHGMWWPFYIENFDWNAKDWRTDDDWMFNSVLTNIDGKLKNHTYGDKNLHKDIANGNGVNGQTNGNGSYLYKHMSNGKETVVTH